MKNTRKQYRHTCQVCQCYYDSSSDDASYKKCPECGAKGKDGFINVEKISPINTASDRT
tara:strand:+ start:1063 stop:1239 length:177 start_codon:yes stop_codon:yes gene_type:complete